MASTDNCTDFSYLYDQIDVYNDKFEMVLPYLNSASYIMNCDNVNHWYSDVTSRATCTDMPVFSIVALVLMGVSAMIVSVMVSMNIAVKSDMELFLEINSNDEFDDETSEPTKTTILIGESKRNLFMKKNAAINSQSLESYFLQTKPTRRTWFRRRNKTSLEKLKQDLEKVYSESGKAEIDPTVISSTSTNPYRSRSNSPTRDVTSIQYRSTQKLPDIPSLTYDSVVRSRGSSNSPKHSHVGSHFDVRETSSSTVHHAETTQAPAPVLKLTNDDNVQHHNHQTVESIQKRLTSFFSKDKTPSRESAKDEIKKQLHMKYGAPTNKVKVSDIVESEIERQIQLISPSSTNEMGIHTNPSSSPVRHRSPLPSISIDSEQAYAEDSAAFREMNTEEYGYTSGSPRSNASPFHGPRTRSPTNAPNMPWDPRDASLPNEKRGFSPSHHQYSPRDQSPSYQHGMGSISPPRQHDFEYSPRDLSPSHLRGMSPSRQQYSPRDMSPPHSPRNISPSNHRNSSGMSPSRQQYSPRDMSPPHSPIYISPSNHHNLSGMSPSRQQYSPRDMSPPHSPRNISPSNHRNTSGLSLSHQYNPRDISPPHSPRSISPSNHRNSSGLSLSHQYNPRDISPPRSTRNISPSNHRNSSAMSLSHQYNSPRDMSPPQSPIGKSSSRLLSPRSNSPVNSGRRIIRVRSKSSMNVKNHDDVIRHNSSIDGAKSNHNPRDEFISNDSGFVMKPIPIQESRSSPLHNESSYGFNLNRGSSYLWNNGTTNIIQHSSQNIEGPEIPISLDNEGQRTKEFDYPKPDDGNTSVSLTIDNNEAEEVIDAPQNRNQNVATPYFDESFVQREDTPVQSNGQYPPNVKSQDIGNSAQFDGQLGTDKNVVLNKPRMHKRQISWSDQFQINDQSQKLLNGENIHQQSETINLNQTGAFNQKLHQLQQNQKNQYDLNLNMETQGHIISQKELYSGEQEYGGHEHIPKSYSNVNSRLPIMNVMMNDHIAEYQKKSEPILRPSLRIGAQSRTFDNRTQTSGADTWTNVENSVYDMTNTTKTVESQSNVESDSKPYKLKVRLSDSSDTTSYDSYSSRGRKQRGRKHRDSKSAKSYSTRSYSTRSYSTRSSSDRSSYYSGDSRSYDTSQSSYYSDASSYSRSDYSDSDSSYESRRRSRRRSYSRRSKRRSKSRRGRR